MQDITYSCSGERTAHQDEQQLTELLHDTCLSGDDTDALATLPSQQPWLYEDTNASPSLSLDSEDFILTAAERRHILGWPEPSAPGEDQLASESSIQAELEPNAHPSKRRRLDSSTEVSKGELPRLDPYSDTYLDAAEDSGIYIPELQDTTGSSACLRGFSRISDQAQGFDGPRDDGDVFPDMDPIHFDAWQSQNPAQYDLAGDPVYDALSGTGSDLGAGCVLDVTRRPVAHQESASLLHVPDFENAPHIGNEDELQPAPIQFTEDGFELQPEVYVPRTRDLARQDNILGAPSARQSLQEFMRMRSKAILPLSDVAAEPPISELAAEPTAINHTIVIPPDVLERHAFIPPDRHAAPRTLHCYLASLAFIQRRNLVRILASRNCAVHLVEREDLNGADLIIDPDTAVLFAPLRNLPTQCATLLNAIGQLSWRFLNILVVFETFPGDSHTHAASPHETLTVNPFSPPAVKALQRLRRDLAIAEACYNKSAESVVAFAYPLTAAAAAETVRAYGDAAHARDSTAGALWRDRPWLELDEEDLVGFVPSTSNFCVRLMTSVGRT